MKTLSVALFAVSICSAACAGSEKDTPTSDTDSDTADPDDEGASPGSSGGAGSGDDPASGGQTTIDDAKEVKPPKASELKYAPCDRGNKLGGFTVQLAERFTSIQGQVLSGVVEANVPEVVSQDKECRLLKGRALFCDPGCAGGETCGVDGKCTPHPENINVGVVTVYGMKDPVVMEPRAPINLYSSQGTLTHPGFSPGDVLSLAAAGGDGKAFQLHAEGIDQLLVPGNSVPVSQGNAVPVTWTASTKSASAMVHLSLNVNNHGSLLAWIECAVPDTGNFEIPGPLLDELLSLGASGFPTLGIHRRSAGSVSLGEGCVEFEARSGLDLDVELEGLVSCNDDADCPLGQTCQGDLTCQ